MAADPLADFYLGETLGGRFEVVRFIAGGGFCLVFEAKDVVTNTSVAVKVLKPGAVGPSSLEFETEGRLLALLQTRPNVLNLLGPTSNSDTITIHKPGLPTPFPLPVQFMVVELADACLAEMVVNRDSVSWAARLDLFRDVVSGVHQMHLGKVVHRDVKSENALVTLGPGVAARACIADLGRSRNLNEPARFLADDYVAGRGDLRFAPPELLYLTGGEDEVAFRRADVYLLGSVLFELCTGQGITSLVFGNPQAVLQQAMQVEPARRSAEYRSRLAEHRSRFEPTFLLAEQELPRHLRDEGRKVLRRLCDPDPAQREKRYRADRRIPTWDLGWLIRRVDVLRTLEKLSRVTRPSRKVA